MEREGRETAPNVRSATTSAGDGGRTSTGSDRGGHADDDGFDSGPLPTHRLRQSRVQNRLNTADRAN